MERLKLFLTAAVWTITTTILAQSTWNQLGDDIDGSSGDGLGSAIAMSADGTIVAIGASSADNTGVVRVYEKSGANWNQIGTDISGDEMNDSFGLSVSLSDDGSVVAIGANTSDIFDDFAASGYVKVYERSGDTWVLKGSKLIASNSGEFFGQSVSLSSDGEVLAVGAPGYNGAGSFRGVTRVYKWTGTSWSQIGADVEGTFDSENSGTSVSLQVSDTDSLLVVGSPAYETTTSAFDNAGRVLIYQYSEGSWGGSWSSPDVLIGQPHDYFGWSVSLSADQNRIAVGAPQDLFASDNYYGIAKIFEYDGSDWLQMGDSIPSLEGDGSQVDGDEFGKAVRLSSDGSYAIIGAPLQEATVSPNGRVEIYNWSGTAWEIVGDSIPGDDSNDGFGSAVAISADGLTIAATSTIHNSGAGQAGMFSYGPRDNTAPVITASQSYNVNEDAENLTVVGTVAAVDAESDNLVNWTIASGNDDGVFAIGTSSGEITVADNATLDFENSTSYTLTLTVGDGIATSAEETITISVNDVNDISPVITASQTFGVSEDAENLTVIGSVVATDGDANTSFSNWMITAGNDDGLFDINATSGEITVADNTTLDFEINSSYTLTLTVSDGVATSAEETIEITVIDINDNLPVITASQSFTIAEDAVNLTSLGTLEATDDDSNTTFSGWSITSGNGDGVFAVNAVTGELTVTDNTNLDFETSTSYTLTLTVSDGTNTSDPEIVSVMVTNVNEDPYFTSSPITAVDDNEIYNYVILKEDPDGDELSLSSSALPEWLSLDLGGVITSTQVGAEMGVSRPFGLAVDDSGNLYYAGLFQSRIYKISSEGEHTVFAGSGDPGSQDGQGTSASFDGPTDVTVDASNNVYVIETVGNRLRKITPAGEVTTVATGFDGPIGIVCDAAGNVYVSDGNTNRILKVTPGGVVSTLAGSGATASVDGTGTGASFNIPYGLGIDGLGNILVTEKGGNRIRKVTPEGVVTTLAGSGQPGYLDGSPETARFNWPSDVSVSASGMIYVTDRMNHRIRTISPQGVVGTLAGSATAGNINGVGEEASFNEPEGIAIDASGALFISDNRNSSIRRTSINEAELTGDPAGQSGDFAITLTLNDGNGGTANQSFTITVTDLTAPSLSSESAVTFEENATVAAYLVVTDDPEATIALGTTKDEAFFLLQGNEISFVTAPDFETPQDADQDNTYLIDLVAMDAAGNVATFEISITVTDADETAPSITSELAVDFVEDGTGVAYTATADEEVTFTLGTDKDEALFSLANGNEISFLTIPDFETPLDSDGDNIFKLDLTATDNVGLTSTVEIAVSITDRFDYSGGNGTAESPYLITAESELRHLSVSEEDLGLHFRQMNDISLVGATALNIPDGSILSEEDPLEIMFSGIYDGNGHVISNNRSSTDLTLTSIFLYTSTEAVIERLGVVDLNNCYGAGLVYYNYGTVRECFVTGTINPVANSTVYTGGLVGTNLGTISNSYSLVSMDNTLEGAQFVGGLVGANAGTIENSYAAGEILDADYMDYIGALVGYSDGTIRNSFWDSDVSGVPAGLGTAKTTFELFNQSTFEDVGWDFIGDPDNNIDPVWIMDNGVGCSGYPRLFAHQPICPAEIGGESLLSWEENSFSSSTYTSSQEVTWGLAGTDGDLFSINTEGVLTFKATPDFEDPQDADKDNVYLVEVVATDNTERQSVLSVTITVTNVDDTAPSITSELAVDFVEDGTGVAYTATADEEVTFTLGTDKDEALFSLANGNEISFLTIPDFETPLDSDGDNIFKLDLTATDNVGLTSTVEIAVSITDRFDYSGGNGTAESPYLITAESELRHLSVSEEDLGLHFRQMNDISLVGATALNIPDGSILSEEDPLEIMFSGIYDGNGHVISNNRSSTDLTLTSIFLYTSTEAVIERLGVVDLNNCYGAGLVYYNYGTVRECFVTGTINPVANSTVYTGGLVGTNLGTISNSYSLVSMDNTLEGAQFVGGLVGANAGTIENSYAAGEILDADYMDYIGALVGYSDGTIRNSFWDSDVNDQVLVEAGTAKTTVEMQRLKTFIETGWDFTGETINGESEVWQMDQETGYPIHAWFKEQDPEIFIEGVIVDENDEAFSAGYVRVRENQNTDPLDLPLEADGTYYADIPAKEYFVSVIPTALDDYFRTYLGNTVQSSSSTKHTENRSEQNIKMIAKAQENLLNGEGKISGAVIEGENGGGRIVQGRILQGTPIVGVSVFLIRTSDERIMTEVVTDENGAFEINGIPNGEYQLVVNIDGVPVDLGNSTVTFDENQSSLDVTAVVSEEGVSITVSVVEVLGAEDEIELSVYPNPATSFVNVQVTGEASIRIMDLKGTVITERSFTNEIELNVETLKESIYLMEIRNADGVSLRKLIKK
ncbi:cadherin domain-containing protein [Marinoscillum sp.]|uniref:cadherin domain-containing protein n=1 Tax=Marinoscillum sp. TaxID=2024838 RepID=UPI003BABAE29